MLGPGEYRLHLSSEGVAAQVLPLTIRAGAQTRMSVDLQPGTRQRVELTVPPGAALARSIQLRVLRGEELVQQSWSLAPQPGEPSRCELWLAPGRYTLQASVEA